MKRRIPCCLIAVVALSSQACGEAVLLESPATTTARAGVRPAKKQDVLVYQEPLRYGGWPANHGIWAWGDEIVLGFTAAWYAKVSGGHAVDFKKPFENWQARSLDGGLTWTVEKPPQLARRPSPSGADHLREPLDFTAPGFALMFHYGNQAVGPSWFFTSSDRCRTWSGPYPFAVGGIDRIATRTDLVVLGQHDCLMLGSAAKADGKEGRIFCARTTDGGLTWKLVSLIGDEPEGYAIMPSSLRLGSGAILTTIRRLDPKKPGFIEAWISDDLGGHWKPFGIPAPDIGGGNPPALVMLPDGRLCLSYGFRAKPFGIRARISNDEGLTWGPEIVLRDDAPGGDLGYPRSIARPDGSMLTAYYFNGPKDKDRTIQATIWTP